MNNKSVVVLVVKEEYDELKKSVDEVLQHNKQLIDNNMKLHKENDDLKKEIEELKNNRIRIVDNNDSDSDSCDSSDDEELIRIEKERKKKLMDTYLKLVAKIDCLKNAFDVMNKIVQKT